MELVSVHPWARTSPSSSACERESQLDVGFVDHPLIIRCKGEFLGYLFLRRASLGLLMEPILVMRKVGEEARLLMLVETNVPHKTTEIEKVEYEV